MTPQLWYCELCGVLGAILYDGHGDVMSVVSALGTQHREASPGCSNGARGLRSIVVENIREPFILRPTNPPRAEQESDDVPPVTGPDGRREIPPSSPIAEEW